MVLFKLEIPISGPNLGVLGENEPLGSFWKGWDPQKALHCTRPRRLRYRLSKSAEPCLLGAVTRNEKIKNLTETLYVDPLWAGPL
jgi:hypothetical protein